MRQNPDPLSDVRGIDGTSRNSQRLDFIACGFQVRKHRVENRTDEARHILTNDPSGLELLYPAKHRWPEIAVIRRASSLSGETERLTGKSPAHKVNCWQGSPVDTFDVSVSGGVWPMLGEDSLTVGIDFDLPRDFKTCSFKAKVKSSYAGEE